MVTLAAKSWLLPLLTCEVSHDVGCFPCDSKLNLVTSHFLLHPVPAPSLLAHTVAPCPCPLSAGPHPSLAVCLCCIAAVTSLHPAKQTYNFILFYFIYILQILSSLTFAKVTVSDIALLPHTKEIMFLNKGCVCGVQQLFAENQHSR